MLSMTGFGSVRGEVEGVEYTVEIRSVNNRYLKAIIRLPEIWSSAEPEVDKLLRSKIHRGSVMIRVQMRLSEDRAAYNVNIAAMKSYLDQLKLLGAEADPTLRIDLASLLQAPGVCEPPSTEELCSGSHDGLMDLISQAIDGLIEMRGEEGEALSDELLGQCDIVEQNISAVARKAPEVVKDYQQRLASRVAELTNAGRVNIDADLLGREVAIFAERCDITEEISRLNGHINQFRKTAHAAGPLGRKLEFIAQEMLREANTIASKANDAEIAQAVVEMKTAVDRIKEQAANVE